MKTGNENAKIPELTPKTENGKMVVGGESMEFKDRLREARIKAGKTQKEVAEALGVFDDSSYRPYESGRRKPTIALAARMADALDVSLDWLAGLSSDSAIHSRIPLERENEE